MSMQVGMLSHKLEQDASILVLNATRAVCQSWHLSSVLVMELACGNPPDTCTVAPESPAMFGDQPFANLAGAQVGAPKELEKAAQAPAI